MVKEWIVSIPSVARFQVVSLRTTTGARITPVLTDVEYPRPAQLNVDFRCIIYNFFNKRLNFASVC